MQCVTFEIPAYIASITEEQCYPLSDKYNNLAVNYINEHEAIRGDLVHFASIPPYRNKGVFIFDGTKLCKLDASIDDYGALPRQFTPIEEGLPITYWDRSIDHNSIVWVLTRTMRNGLVVSPTVNVVTGTTLIAAQFAFKFNGTTYTVIYDGEGNTTIIPHQQVTFLFNILKSRHKRQPLNCKSSTFSLKNALYLTQDLSESK